MPQNPNVSQSSQEEAKARAALLAGMKPQMLQLDDHKSEVLRLETELAKAQTREIEACTELARVRNKVIKDPRSDARYEQAALNKEIADLGPKIEGVKRDLTMARKQLALAEGQEEAKARVERLAKTALLPKDKFYEIETPDHRIVRVKHSSRENLEAELLPGYTFRGAVFGCDEEGKGGVGGMAMDLLTAALEARGFHPDKGAA